MFFLLDVEKSKKDNFLKNIFYINNLYPKKNQQDTGEYTFKIDVSDALFYQQQGNIYVFFIFREEIKNFLFLKLRIRLFVIFPNPATDCVTVEGSKKVTQLSLYNLDGRI